MSYEGGDGKRINQYVLEKCLGQGAFGAVLKAFNERDGQEYVSYCNNTTWLTRSSSSD